jgi:hypothetical protein
MPRFIRLRFQAEVAIALICAAVFVATLVQPQWFELLFDEAPDGGDGSLEAGIALACSLFLGVVCARLAHLEWRRAAAAKGGG